MFLGVDPLHRQIEEKNISEKWEIIRVHATFYLENNMYEVLILYYYPTYLPSQLA